MMKHAVLYFLFYCLLAVIRWVGFSVFNSYFFPLFTSAMLALVFFGYHMYRQKNLLPLIPMALFLFWYEIAFFFNFYVYPGYHP